jgi:hypothetical protein
MDTAAPVGKSIVIKRCHCIGMSYKMSIVVACKIAANSKVTEDAKGINLCRIDGLIVA